MGINRDPAMFSCCPRDSTLTRSFPIPLSSPPLACGAGPPACLRPPAAGGVLLRGGGAGRHGVPPAVPHQRKRGLCIGCRLQGAPEGPQGQGVRRGGGGGGRERGDAGACTRVTAQREGSWEQSGGWEKVPRE